ncbi:class I SAM-dependent methyltransferase [Thiohalocapsa marina]|uniref:Class I SAM-dependent methyltransferase n=1 Tax=Thiohalocapsa marina TaxID=424902 RepID=A0A5M8FRL2_9GAMM|nr:class I SAM-dependent methyltransferase [Thiohalocapsa marina]KAA6183952.1 class I SAM-dependent methyltransferase [Thiohalocapsa marina]
MTEPTAHSGQTKLQAQTASHYDQYPFDFLTTEDEARIEEIQPGSFREFVRERLSPGDRVAEIGCGPGRATLYLTRLGHQVWAVDLSLGSLRLARRRAPAAHYAAATNLSLPFADASFDAVISDGVIHHTPDARRSFEENARILKPGGYLYLGVYRRHGYYYYFYTYLGIPIRWLERRRWGRWLIHATLLPIYYLVHLIKSRGRRTWKGARHFFYDYIITPRASFHTREDVEQWGRQNRLRLAQYVAKVGNTHVFFFEKSGMDVRSPVNI